ncbi:MAG: GNAT family N-acetyltransferase [Anaerolineae bacterium]|nr:GNAT family N-acetyltransferase [Anaerolineae bacterium]
MAEVRIEHLAEHTMGIPLLAAWAQQQWGHLLPEITFAIMVSNFKKRSFCHQIPETFVAVADKQLVGMASIDPHDMVTRPNLSPWLAAVYVAPEFRLKGIGSRLVRAVMQEAAVLELDRIYLFTPNKINFYNRLGWQFFEHTAYRGEEVVIMQYQVNHTNPGEFSNDQT